MAKLLQPLMKEQNCTHLEFTCSASSILIASQFGGGFYIDSGTVTIQVATMSGNSPEDFYLNPNATEPTCSSNCLAGSYGSGGCAGAVGLTSCLVNCGCLDCAPFLTFMLRCHVLILCYM